MTIKSMLFGPHRTGLRARNSLSGSSARWVLPLVTLAVLFIQLPLSPAVRALASPRIAEGCWRIRRNIIATTSTSL